MRMLLRVRTCWLQRVRLVGAYLFMPFCQTVRFIMRNSVVCRAAPILDAVRTEGVRMVSSYTIVLCKK